MRVQSVALTEPNTPDMNRFALLIQTTPTIDDTNYPRIARQLDDAGYVVDIFFIDTLCLRQNKVCAQGFRWDSALDIGGRFPAAHYQEINHDYVWILGFGERNNFLDKYQLLGALPGACRVLNSLDAVMHLNAKYFTATRSAFRNPDTWASTQADDILTTIHSEPGFWIVKPPAGSLGRDVYRVSRSDSNLEAIVTGLCGPRNNRYTLLQRYVSEIEHGEKRVLIAGGKVIDQYLRKPGSDHRTNLAQGARIEPCELTDEERAACQQLAATLLAHGVVFAGIDLAFPWLIEVNVVNPGGIATIHELTGVDQSSTVVKAILQSLNLEF